MSIRNRNKNIFFTPLVTGRLYPSQKQQQKMYLIGNRSVVSKAETTKNVPHWYWICCIQVRNNNKISTSLVTDPLYPSQKQQHMYVIGTDPLYPSQKQQHMYVIGTDPLYPSQKKEKSTSLVTGVVSKSETIENVPHLVQICCIQDSNNKKTPW